MMMSHIQTETSEVKCHVASDKAQSRGRGRGQTETWRSDKITPTASVTIQRRRRRIKEKKNKGGEEEEEEGYGAEDLVRWDSVAADTIVHSLMKKTEQWGRLRSVWTKSQETNYDVTVSHWTVMSPCHCCFILTHVRDRRRRLTDGFIHLNTSCQFVPLLEKINCQHREDPRKQETLQTQSVDVWLCSYKDKQI